MKDNKATKYAILDKNYDFQKFKFSKYIKQKPYADSNSRSALHKPDTLNN